MSGDEFIIVFGVVFLVFFYFFDRKERENEYNIAFHASFDRTMHDWASEQLSDHDYGQYQAARRRAEAEAHRIANRTLAASRLSRRRR